MSIIYEDWQYAGQQMALACPSGVLDIEKDDSGGVIYWAGGGKVSWRYVTRRQGCPNWKSFRVPGGGYG